MIDIKVPAVGESISEVTLVKWLKQEGQYVERDEVIAELESEKATFEVNAEKAGVLKTVGKEGDTLKIGDVVAQIDETAAAPANGNGSPTANASATAAPVAASASNSASSTASTTASPAAQAPEPPAGNPHPKSRHRTERYQERSKKYRSQKLSRNRPTKLIRTD